jgi:hypothetical protein
VEVEVEVGMGMKVESCGGCDGRRIARRRGEDTEEGVRAHRARSSAPCAGLRRSFLSGG